MRRASLTIFVAVLFSIFSQSIMEAKTTVTAKNASAISKGNSAVSTTSNSSAAAETKATANMTEDVIRVQPAVIDAKDHNETTTFTAPPGALYTSSDECG